MLQKPSIDYVILNYYIYYYNIFIETLKEYNESSDVLLVNCGLRQGNVLSATLLFIINCL